MKKRRGFTLIEMVIVLFIISLLLLLMIPNLAAQRENANQKSEEALVTTVTNQAEMYSERYSDDATLDKLKDKNYITEKKMLVAKSMISNGTIVQCRRVERSHP